MSKFAEYFATVSNGKIVMLTEAHPPHELLENQIMLTGAEFRLIEVSKTLEDAKKLIGSIEYKLGKVNDATSS